MVLNEEQLVEHLFGMTESADALDYQGYRRSTRRDKPMHIPDPGPVTVRRGDGSVETRAMNEQELAAWKKAEGIEDE